MPVTNQSGDGATSGSANQYDQADIDYLVSSGHYDRASAEAWIQANGTANSAGFAFDLSDAQRLSALSQASNAEGEQMLEQLFGMQTEQGIALINANVAASMLMADANIARYPNLSSTALSTAQSATSQINDFMRQQFESSLDQLYPQWREQMVGAAATAQGDSIALTNAFRQNVLPGYIAAADQMSAQALSNVNAQLRGEINPDVAAQLQRHAAEVSQSIGVRGQAAQYLTARDLGLNSYQLQQQGLQNAQAALGIAPYAYASANQTLQAPVNTGINATNLINAYRAPLTDLGSLYTQGLGIMSGLGAINPTQAYSTNAQTLASTGSLVQNQLQFNAARTDQNYWNQVNYQAQQRAAQQAGQTNWGGLIGAAAGAGIGAMVPGGGLFGGLAGAQVGGGIGSMF